MRPSSFRPMFLSLLCPFALAIAGCDGCGGTGVGDPDDDAGEPGGVGFCEDHTDCPDGRCEGGACVPDDVTGEDGGTPGQPGDDAGVSVGVLAVHPGTEVEFGAQLLGYPVTVDVTLSNAGTAPLTILAVLLDDDTGEFSADPAGTMNVVLAPGDNMIVSLTHTPSDGVPDAAEVKVLHDGEGNLTTLSLFAEFKGDASLSLSEDLAVLSPSAEAIAFGEADTGTTTTRTLWVRNTGSSDSILTISDVTITPPTAGFALVEDPELPFALGAWSTALCPDEDVAACPPGASACTDMICVDEDGEPLNALPLDIEFTAGTLPSQATLTLEHDEGGGATQTDVELTGLPTQPELSVTPAEVAFPPTLVGAPTPAQITISVENVGAGPLFVTRVVEPSSSAVFSFDYSRPVPMVDGDPALRIDPASTPLEITVTFTPQDAEGYASSLTLHTNDNTALQLPIPLAGSGVVCQANAHVEVGGGGEGVCVCDGGFIDCGGECKVPGATACGDACVDCTAVSGLGTGTDASCSVGGTCEYACVDGYYDLNSGSDGSPGGGSWDGCEYRCAQQPALGFELCNGVDDDCNGSPDDGLARDASDTPSRNDTRASAKVVAPIDEVPATPSSGSTETLTSRTLYPDGDSDWFKVKAIEGDGSLDCAEEVPCIDGGQENYRTVFEVVSPSGLDYDIEVFAPTSPNYDDPSGAGVLAKDDNRDNIVGFDWSRGSDIVACFLCNPWLDIGCWDGGYGCAFDDSQVFFVNVKPQAGQADTFSCEPYELKVTSISLPPGSN